MPEIRFDLQQYIKQRKGADEALARSGAPYAYPGDQRVLRALSRVTPVTLAVEATVRLWKSVARGEILGTAVKVSEHQFPEIYRTALDCAATLHIAVPTVYIAPNVSALNAQTFGTSDDAYIVLNGVLVDHLTVEELRFIIGHECGHIQNNHVVYLTALYYLMYSANTFLRWIVAPAVLALQSWMRRAEVTSDRAGLICTGNLEPAISALTKLALGSHELAAQLNITEYLKQLEELQQAPHGTGELGELFLDHPYLPKRIEGLRLFAQTHYFLKVAQQTPKSDEGSSLSWCDSKVKELLAGTQTKKRKG